MNLKSHLLNYLNKFNQLHHLLGEYTDLRNLWMASLDFWNERKLFGYLSLNKSKSIEFWKSKDFRAYVLS